MALEDILSRIRSDGEERAAAIVAEGERDRELELQEYREHLEKRFREELRRLSDRAEEHGKRMRFHVRKEIEREIANARRAVMDEAIEAAILRLVGLEDERYLAIVSNLLEKADLEGRIEVLISPSDERRITPSFLDRNSTSGKTFVLSDDRLREGAGGVLLKAGRISVNATFEMIARLCHEELVMSLAGHIGEG